MNGGAFKDGLVFSMATSMLTYLNYKMHRAVVKQSANNPKNSDGDSVGAFGSRVKVGGGRETLDSNGNALARRSIMGGSQGAPTAGTRDLRSNFFGTRYQPGSVRDHIVENTGAAHDWMRNATGSYIQTVSGEYDIIGNAKHLTGFASGWDSFKNFALVLPAVPFGTASLISYTGIYGPIGSET